MLASITPFLRIRSCCTSCARPSAHKPLPGNQTLLGLALFLTMAVMQPVADQVYREAIVPMRTGAIGQLEALEAAQPPIKRYLSRFTRERDVELFLEVTGKPRPATPAELDLTVLAPA
ncbi:MAG: hypothetical protein R2748_11865 [Bryobacterales bacterium]